MSTAPFKAAGGLAQMVRRAAEGYAVPSPELEVPPARASGSRRRRLWEIPHRLHCPVVGVCFDCDELRALMRKVMHFPPDTSDYVLHTTAVGNCDQRGQLAELLQRTLEQRFRLTLKSPVGGEGCRRPAQGVERCLWRRQECAGHALGVLDAPGAGQRTRTENLRRYPHAAAPAWFRNAYRS